MPSGLDCIHLKYTLPLRQLVALWRLHHFIPEAIFQNMKHV
ncbi:hypothetical protein [Azospirillum palustre]